MILDTKLLLDIWDFSPRKGFRFKQRVFTSTWSQASHSFLRRMPLQEEIKIIKLYYFCCISWSYAFQQVSPYLAESETVRHFMHMTSQFRSWCKFIRYYSSCTTRISKCADAKAAIGYAFISIHVTYIKLRRTFGNLTNGLKYRITFWICITHI